MQKQIDKLYEITEQTTILECIENIEEIYFKILNAYELKDLKSVFNETVNLSDFCIVFFKHFNADLNENI